MSIYIKTHVSVAKMLSHSTRKIKRKNKTIRGSGLIDYIIDKLPEIHIPGYQYCGPGTNLKKRLARGDPGINPLDQACKLHDIVYSKEKKSEARNVADKALIARALARIYSKDAKFGERAAALLTTGLMGAKLGLSKVGLGLKKNKNRRRRRVKKRTKVRRSKTAIKGGRIGGKKKHASRRSKVRKTITFGKVVRGVKASIKKSNLKLSSLGDTIKAAIRSAKDLTHNKTAKVSRILKLPKFGGNVLPIVPILSALSAVGTIPASTVAVIKTIKKIQQATQQSGQMQKKIGRGLYLTREASGRGFYLKPFKQLH